MTGGFFARRRRNPSACSHGSAGRSRSAAPPCWWPTTSPSLQGPGRHRTYPRHRRLDLVTTPELLWRGERVVGRLARWRRCIGTAVDHRRSARHHRLFVFISIPMLDKRMAERREGWDAHAQDTGTAPLPPAPVGLLRLKHPTRRAAADGRVHSQMPHPSRATASPAGRAA